MDLIKKFLKKGFSFPVLRLEWSTDSKGKSRLHKAKAFGLINLFKRRKQLITLELRSGSENEWHTFNSEDELLAFWDRRAHTLLHYDFAFVNKQQGEKSIPLKQYQNYGGRWIENYAPR